VVDKDIVVDVLVEKGRYLGFVVDKDIVVGVVVGIGRVVGPVEDDDIADGAVVVGGRGIGVVLAEDIAVGVAEKSVVDNIGNVANVVVEGDVAGVASTVMVDVGIIVGVTPAVVRVISDATGVVVTFDVDEENIFDIVDILVVGNVVVIIILVGVGSDAGTVDGG
jgi:hypothetical protein